MSDRAVPNLPSRDFGATKVFYGRFGFATVFCDDRWLIMRRGTVQLEFFLCPDLDPARSSFMCTLRVADVDELYAAIAAAGVSEGESGFPRLHPVVKQPWGLRAGYLNDEDGTQLALVEDAGD